MKHEAIIVKNAPPAVGPYSQAVVYEKLIYTSGQISMDAAGEIVGNTVEEQAGQVLENLKNILEAAGSGLNNVLKCMVFLQNMNDFGKVNAIYAQYFAENLPARSCIEVARLPKDVLIEIEAIAYKKKPLPSLSREGRGVKLNAGNKRKRDNTNINTIGFRAVF